MSVNISTICEHTYRSALAPLLTVDELGLLFRVSRRTIARWCRHGELPRPLKIGGLNRWNVEEIQNVIQRGNADCEIDHVGSKAVTVA